MRKADAEIIIGLYEMLNVPTPSHLTPQDCYLALRPHLHYDAEPVPKLQAILKLNYATWCNSSFTLEMLHNIQCLNMHMHAASLTVKKNEPF
jgi:hypothetical protein